MSFDILKVREDFPILQRDIREGIKLVYLDSSATSQKPDVVIRAMDHYYRNYNANIHRGLHTLAEEATSAYEASRQVIVNFINANPSRQVIFTRNTTESINLVANTWGRANLHSGETIILTEMEHHSNLVPWQILAKELNLRLEFISINAEGVLDLDNYRRLLDLKPRLVAFTHMSNVLGTINPAKEIIQMAHKVGALALVDGAQSVPHFPIDVKDLDVDFLAFSAHKMCGPTGIGVLYGRESILVTMPPFLGGGDMIRRVNLRSFVPNELPYKFEAGTPAIAEAIGFGEAIRYLSSIGLDSIRTYEHHLTEYAIDQLKSIPGLRVLGPDAGKRGSLVSFTLDGIHPHDVAQILDNDGIAIRAGHHCAMPLHDILKIPASSRASFYFYNTQEEVDTLVKGIYKVKKIFN